MTRDDIISMARDVLEECDGKDYYDYTHNKIHWWGEAEAIIKFAELVAAEERETCAKVCDDLDGTFFKRRAVKLDKQQYGATDILKIMRDVNAMVTEDCADAIRARGQV